MTALRFDILARSKTCGARRGVIHTARHGSFETPAFMPVGTRAAVKGLLPRLVREAGAQIVLNNTYHLMLRPGVEVIEALGGVHEFMRWDGPILTDSGGYQVFSMSDLSRIDDDGVVFRSIVDGSEVNLTPELAVEAQNRLGADIIMALDDCPSAGPEAEIARLEEADRRTAKWLGRCIRAHARAADQALFGIVQGGTDPARRTRSVEQVCGHDLPGYAIGGVGVGEGPEEIRRIVEHTAPLLPGDRPRYLMGVGYERDIVMAVRAGIDLFDCVLPTRNGRNASAFTRTGAIRLRNAAFARDGRVIEERCGCATCVGGFSRAYLRHLFLSGEMLGPILVSVHNIAHFQRLMTDLRTAIGDEAWPRLASEWPVLSAPVDKNVG